jgi:tryptophanyl-tRNA synthetase
VDSKRALAENMVKYLAPIREKAAEWKAHPERIRQVLGDGAQTARVLAQDTLEKVRGVLGLYA